MAKKRRERADDKIAVVLRSKADASKPVPQRNAANARERARMRVLSRAFCRLKTSLPWVPADTKLSKLDTLRLASTYISHLRTILTSDDSYCIGDLVANGTTDGKPSRPIALTWPFTFQNRTLCSDDTGSSFTGMDGGSDISDVQDARSEYQDYSSCEVLSRSLRDLQHPTRTFSGHYLQ